MHSLNSQLTFLYLGLMDKVYFLPNEHHRYKQTSDGLTLNLLSNSGKRCRPPLPSTGLLDHNPLTDTFSLITGARKSDWWIEQHRFQYHEHQLLVRQQPIR
jgi:hypothetical protein